MAKRYFSDEIMMSDAFLEMSGEAIKLYIALNYQADNDGVVNNRNSIMRSINVNQKAFDELVYKAFIIDFEDLSVCVIKHWWMHNIKRQERYHPTNYPEAMERLVKKDNSAYTLTPKWQPKDHQPTAIRSRYVSSLTSNSNSLKTLSDQHDQKPSDAPIDTQNDTANDTAPKIGAINVEQLAIDGRFRFDSKIFERFWANYPRKIGKQKCLNWFKSKKVKPELLEKMLASVNEQKKSEQWQKDNGAFIPHPYTWLNQGRWEDESEVDLDIVLSDKEKAQLAEQEKHQRETAEARQKLMKLNLLDNRLKETVEGSALYHSLTLDKMVLLGKITREEADELISQKAEANKGITPIPINGLFKKM